MKATCFVALRGIFIVSSCDASPSLLIETLISVETDSSRVPERIVKQTSENLEVLCRKVRCIESEESSMVINAKITSLSPEAIHKIFPLMGDENAAGTNRELVSMLLRNDRELCNVYPNLPSSFSKGSYAWHETNDESECRKNLNLVESRCYVACCYVKAYGDSYTM